MNIHEFHEHLCAFMIVTRLDSLISGEKEHRKQKVREEREPWKTRRRKIEKGCPQVAKIGEADEKEGF